jgi:putative glutamine amidotransferase
VSRPLIAVTGRRLGAHRATWPYAHATALPRAYLQAVRRSGADPVVLDAFPIDRGEAAALVSRFDALVFTGGPDVDPACYGEPQHPSTYGVEREADDFEIALLHAALARDVPTLAICRGAQVVNIALGGTLYQHIVEDPGVESHGRPGETDGQYVHDVEVDASSMLHKVMGVDRARCSCHHHQAVARLGDGLHVTARASDGIVEGLELDGAPMLAVQWHPEDTAAEDGAQQRLFDWLCDFAAPREG